jgi:5'-deoxynucleotidase YfbR-like HD superfamily hydrolase
LKSEKVFDYPSLAFRLSAVSRYHKFKLVRPQSVAEHSFNVAVLLCYFSDVLVRAGIFSDRDHMIRRGLLHDLPEEVSGDVLFNTKEAIMDSVTSFDWNLFEQALVEDSYGEVDVNTIAAIWGHKTPTFDDSLCELADMLECFFKMIEEYNLGNTSILSVLQRSLDLSWARFCMFPDNVKEALSPTPPITQLIEWVKAKEEQLKAEGVEDENA